MHPVDKKPREMFVRSAQFKIIPSGSLTVIQLFSLICSITLLYPKTTQTYKDDYQLEL